MANDYYATLRIPKTASGADIKKAYLQMARDTHPDRFKDPEEKKKADAHFQKITEAYNQLRHVKSRQEYDRDLAKEKRSPEQEADLFFKNAELREQSEAYKRARIIEAKGEATRFEALLAEYQNAPEVTRRRLYLETMEEILPGVEKMILEPNTVNMLPILPLGNQTPPLGAAR